MFPVLHTERLALTPFTPADAPLVQRYAGDARIAATTAFIPHPYPDGVAGKWIATHLPDFLRQANLTLAIRSRDGAELFGAINLKLPGPGGGRANDGAGNGARDSAEAGGGNSARADGRNAGRDGGRAGELGYWVGVPFWNRGICTEAARAMIRHGFEEMGLDAIRAHYFAGNAASGRVMEKCGMTRDGVLPRSMLKNGVLRDTVRHSIRREDFLRQRAVKPGD